MSGALASVLSSLFAIQVHAAGDCPGAADVERRLAPLLGTGTEASASDVATIQHGADGTLLVSLADTGGRAIGDRRFSRPGACGNQAETVAVTLAIWEAQIHPEITLRLDRLAPEAAPPPTADAAIAARAPDENVARPPRAAFSLGAGAAADWQPGSWAPAVRVELGVGRPDRRWRARLAAVGVGRHALDVAPGQATWWRGALSLGADVDVARARRLAVALGAGAVGGVAQISGAGYSLDHTSRSFDAGGELRARAQWRPGRVQPWVGVSVVGWLRRQVLDVQGAGVSRALPRLEPMVALGADFVW